MRIDDVSQLPSADINEKINGGLLEKHNFVISRAPTAKSKQWVRQDLDFMRFLDLFSHHRGDKRKDGPAFVAGEMAGAERKASAVTTLFFAVYDIDTGQTYDEVRDMIDKRKLAAIMYTTYSHLKTKSHIKTDNFVRWCQKKGIDTNTMTQLHTQERIEQYVDDTPGLREKLGTKITVKERLEQTEDGMQIVVEHPPIEKFRVLFPLKAGFTFASHGYTSTEQIQTWKRYYFGIGRELGLKFDKACADPPRLYYFPSHPILQDGSDALHRLDHLLDPIVNEDGTETVREMLDFNKFPMVELNEHPSASSKAYSPEDNARPTTGEVPRELMRWKGKYPAFDMGALVIEKCGGTQTDKGVAFPCSFDHSTPDNGTRTMILRTHSGGWSVKCQGESCAGRDTLDYVAAWLDAGTITHEDLERADLGGGPFGAPQAEPSADPAVDDLRKTAKDCLFSIAGIKDIALSAPGGGIRKHLEQEQQQAFDTICAEFAARQKLTSEGALKVIEREIFRQVTPKDIRRYVDRFAQINVGGHHMIVDMHDPKSNEALMKPDAFVALNAADYIRVEVQRRGGTETKQVPRAESFLNKYAAATRFIQRGFTFDPRRVGDELDSETLNLYTGMKIAPDPAGSCEFLKRLIREVWCHGNDDLFMWCWEYLLHIVARPWERPDTALAIRGEPGAGKSLVFEACLKTILDDLLLIVDDENVVLGAFNSSIKGKLGIVLEEAAFAGNAKLFDKLKARVTGHTVHINEKHKPAYDLENFARLIVISNHDHFMHVKQGDRRYTVIETSDAAAERWKEEKLYEQLIEEWRNGGAARFVYEALNHEFRTVEGSKSLVIQTSFKTDALAEQVTQSRSILEKTVVGFLLTGELNAPDGKVLRWSDLTETDVPAMFLQSVVVGEMREKSAYDAKHHDSLKAIMAAFKRLGCEPSAVREDVDGKKITVRRFPSRMQALDAAKAKGAITADEYELGGGGQDIVARAKTDADDAAQTNAKVAAALHRREVAKRIREQVTALKDAIQCKMDEPARAEARHARVAKAGRDELAKLPTDIEAIEVLLTKTRKGNDRSRLQAELADAEERLAALPGEIDAAELKQRDAFERGMNLCADPADVGEYLDV